MDVFILGNNKIVGAKHALPLQQRGRKIKIINWRLMIEKYSFGMMIVGDKEYSNDLIFFNQNIIENTWRRTDGHMLKYRDLKNYIEKYNPRKLLIGTGYYGRMEVSDNFIEELNNRDYDFQFGLSVEMVEVYNKVVNEEGNNGLMACFHLAC